MSRDGVSDQKERGDTEAPSSDLVRPDIYQP